MVNVTLQVPDALDQKLRARAAKEGQDPASIAIAILERELAGYQSPETASRLSYEEWHREFMEWAKSRPKIDVVVDDSRESIYEGRGE